MSDWLQSISGSPWTIHSAMDLPTAGPSLTQTAAADQRPLTSGVSPSSGIPSGVRAMRPLMAYFCADLLVAEDGGEELERVLELRVEVTLA